MTDQVARHTEMVYETIFTILFALGVGVAFVVYTARFRHGAPRMPVAHAPAVAAYHPTEFLGTAQAPQGTPVQQPVVEAPTAGAEDAIMEVPVAAPVAAPSNPADLPAVTAAAAEVSSTASTTADDHAGAPAHQPTKAARPRTRRTTSTRPRAKPSERMTGKRSKAEANHTVG